MDEESQFQAEYVKALDMCHGSLLSVVSEDLSLGDARRLEPLLRQMGISLPWWAEKLSPVQQIAHRCARVLDWAQDEEWCPGLQDWQPLKERIKNLIQKDVPTASIVLAVLAARVSDGFRERLNSHGGPSSGTFIELGREDQKEYTRLVEGVTKSVEALRHRIRLAEASTSKAAKGKQGTTMLGPFPALSMRLWSNQLGPELDELLCSLYRSLEADRGMFREKLKIREQVVPGSGHRQGHYSPVIYDAYEMVLDEVKTHWQLRGAVPTAMGLFQSVGIRLTEYGTQNARQRKRQAAL
jgi:hypothetical protein